MNFQKWLLQILIWTSFNLFTIPSLAELARPEFDGGPMREANFKDANLSEEQQSCVKKMIGETRQGAPPSPEAFREAIRKCSAKTEAQCEECAKADSGSVIGKLRIAAQDVDQKAKDEVSDLESEIRRIFDKRRERLLGKIDTAPCSQTSREGSELDAQKLIRSADGDGVRSSSERDRERERSREKDKKSSEVGGEKLQSILELRLREELEEAIEDKKKTCARRERLKDFESDTGSSISRAAQSGQISGVMNGSMNGNSSASQMQMLMLQQQQLMAMAAMRSMNSGMGNYGMSMGGSTMFGTGFGSSMLGNSMFGNSMGSGLQNSSWLGASSPYMMNISALPLTSNLYGSNYGSNIYGSNALSNTRPSMYSSGLFSSTNSLSGYPYTNSLMKIGQTNFLGR